jgi:hypothetical protein
MYTKIKKLEKLSEDQLIILEETKNEMIETFLNNQPIDLDISKELIKNVYEMINLPLPEIIISSNPYQMQLDANQLKGNRKIEVFDTSYYIGIWYASFYAYAETYLKLGILNDNHNTSYSNYFKIRGNIKSNIYSALEFENVIFICPKPKHILKNSAGNMHSIEKMAIQWKDGYGQYYINGRNISEALFNQLSNKEYTFEMFSKESDEEVKSSIIAFYQEAYGDEYLFRFLSKNLKEVDEYVNNTPEMYLQGTTNSANIGVYTLYKGNINNTDVAYIRCYCPSTDRMFFLGVHPDIKTAKDAIASLCQVPYKLKDYLTSIQRQGEIFSFNFNEKGTEFLNSITKEELNNKVSLTGDEYFNNIQYEY